MFEEEGYIKLFRKSRNSRVFQNEGLWKVWTWCLMRANFAEAWVPVQTGKGESEVELKAGQFIFGRKTAARELRMKESSVWDRMQKLKNMENIDIQSNSHYSIISVVIWGTYQGNHKKGNKQLDRQATGNQQATDTDKNNKNDKKRFGTHVLLLPKEYEDLCSDFEQSIVDSKIEDLDNYIGTNPSTRSRKYKDHNRVVRTWLKREGVKPIQAETPKMTCRCCKMEIGKHELRDGKCPSCGEAV